MTGRVLIFFRWLVSAVHGIITGYLAPHQMTSCQWMHQDCLAFSCTHHDTSFSCQFQFAVPVSRSPAVLFRAWRFVLRDDSWDSWFAARLDCCSSLKAVRNPEVCQGPYFYSQMWQSGMLQCQHCFLEPSRRQNFWRNELVKTRDMCWRINQLGVDTLR